MSEHIRKTLSRYPVALVEGYETPLGTANFVQGLD